MYGFLKEYILSYSPPPQKSFFKFALIKLNNIDRFRIAFPYNTYWWNDIPFKSL